MNFFSNFKFVQFDEKCEKNFKLALKTASGKTCKFLKFFSNFKFAQFGEKCEKNFKLALKPRPEKHVNF